MNDSRPPCYDLTKYFSKINLPLEPQTAMVSGLLLECNSRRQAFPAWSLITDNSLNITAYNKHYIYFIK